MEKIVIIGGGGHAKVVIDLIRAGGHYNIVGALDPSLAVGAKTNGIPVIGDNALLPNLRKNGINNVAIGVGSITNPHVRKQLYMLAREYEFMLPALVHPHTWISDNAQLSDGVQIMAGAIVQTNVQISDNVIINTGAHIDHDCLLGKHTHIAPGAIVAGSVHIEDEVFVGANATIIQGCSVGHNAVVAAGAVVIHNVPAGVTVMGVPARIHETN